MGIDYSVAGPLTRLDPQPLEVLAGAAQDPISICAPVASLVIQPSDPLTHRLSADRLAENRIRPASQLVARLLALDSRSLSTGRGPNKRIVGTCRHFAVLACALLRHHGLPARVRCGFATYFQSRQAVDHWIIEFQDGNDGRWRRLDPEVLGQGVIDNADDLTAKQFMTGGEAWQAFRRSTIDAASFGVHGTDNWGPAEIRGNAVKDLAALNKVEMLPWDEWGRMTDAYNGATGADYDALLDDLAAAGAADDQVAIAEIYSHADLRVPDELIT